MSIATRQSELFAAEDWKVLYQAFTSINFNSSDPTTINAAMRAYLVATFPESFNDYIESSEFVALLDLLAWLAGNLAFKTDLAVRENFLETAESRESILRLARFLSYSPGRNLPATGIVKIVQVSTNDDVQDSYGTDLTNTTINWNDPDNANWHDQFTSILNNAFIGTNPFGVPLSTGTVSTIETQLYRLNGLLKGSSVGFSATVSGQAMAFEVCNGNFSDGGVLFEQAPNSAAALNLFYLNDANGYGSVQNGFFLLFKQGTTQTSTTIISTPIENQRINITSAGINQNDVWVQTVDDNAIPLIDWVKVPAVISANITYNDISPNQRNIFQVITRDNDEITLRFSDGNFGNAPSGNIQTTYRVSNGLNYSIKPSEINLISLPFTYYNPVGVAKTITLTFSLQSTVSNASSAETTDQIRQRAPLVYATQNRMVSGEDYNTYPLSSNLAAKINAVNRVYSGHSRYIDLNDPTGTYRDLTIIGEDGVFFREEAQNYVEVPLSLNRTAPEIMSEHIQPMLQATTTQNAVNNILMGGVLSGAIQAPGSMLWTLSSASSTTTTGTLSVPSPLVQTGAMLRMTAPSSPRPFWVGVAAISGPISTPPSINAAGPVTLSYSVPTGAVVTAILPRYNSTIPAGVSVAIRNALALKLGFSLAYDYAVTDSLTGGVGELVFLPSAPNLGDPVLTGSQIMLMTVDYVPSLFRINVRGQRYVFESASEVEWYDNGTRAVDITTGDANADTIRIMRVNENLNDVTGKALRVDYDLAVGNLYVYPDGTAEPRRTQVTFADENEDGFPDHPDLWYLVSSASSHQALLFWANDGTTPFCTALTTMIVYEDETHRMAATPPNGTVAFQISAALQASESTFWVYQTGTGWTQDFTQTYSYGVGRGHNVAAQWIDSSGTVTTPYRSDQIIYKWNHIATSSHRLDPASTNLHDIFVLTYDYDALIRQWIKLGADVTLIPQAPSELDLRLAFEGLETYRMFSDGIIWRPVSYKFLFGPGADPTLRATFKVVRIANTNVSDGEIQSQVINAINAYFAIQNWDFGDTFYYTEMAAYIHQTLAGLIASIVIVPANTNSAFGDGFEVSSRSDQMFISTAQVSDVVLISSNTPSALRIR